MISVFDGLKVANIDVKPVTSILSHLPLYEQQIGWLIPAIVGAIIGVIISRVIPERQRG
ncbi:Branched-chain amino acid transport protein [Sporosarcina pasteurii]|uniref:Branched-chain amino acid transport system carrier protein n=1 Tax=Sporosarcina pasteurii TaxID=1474 RepID=A0A380BFZ6_SPOPA|nr:Branched-chain amino acid transport protein [Sporosarcina pasteurii]